MIALVESGPSRIGVELLACKQFLTQLEFVVTEIREYTFAVRMGAGSDILSLYDPN